MVEPGEGCLCLRRFNALRSVHEEVLHPSVQVLMELDNEFGQQAFNRFSDGIEQDINRSRASAVPVHPHDFGR